MNRSCLAPLIAVGMLLMVLYVLSYLALVVPGGYYVPQTFAIGTVPWPHKTYRCGDDIAKRVFWPLEQADRRIRPRLWYAEEEKLSIDFDE